VDERTFLLEQAARFRRLANEIFDSKTEHVLLAMAEEYEQRAAAVRDDATAPADGPSAQG